LGEEIHMTCPICEQNLEIVEKITDDFDGSVVTKYAICRDCRKQWKLKTTTKTDSPSLSIKPLVGTGKEEDSKQTKVKKISDDDLFLADAGVNPAKSKASDKENKSKRQGRKPSGSSKRNIDGDIGKDKGLSRNRDKSKDRMKNEDRFGDKDKARGKSKGKEDRKGVHKNRPSTKASIYDDYTDSEESEGGFKPVRILIAVLSIIAFGFLLYQGGYITFFDHVIGQAELSVAIAMILLGTLCLISGLIILFTLKKNGILPFISPAILYLIGGVVAFIFRGDSMILLAGSIVALIVAILLIILVLIQQVKSNN